MVLTEPISKAAAAQEERLRRSSQALAPCADSPKRRSDAEHLRNIICSGSGSNEPLRSHSPCASQSRHCANARSIRSKRAQIAVEDISMDRNRTTARHGKLAKTCNPAQVNLGGRSLVTKREKILREAIHLVTEHTATQGLEHPTIASEHFKPADRFLIAVCLVSI